MGARSALIADVSDRSCHTSRAFLLRGSVLEVHAQRVLHDVVLAVLPEPQPQPRVGHEVDDPEEPEVEGAQAAVDVATHTAVAVDDADDGVEQRSRPRQRQADDGRDQVADGGDAVGSEQGGRQPVAQEVIHDSPDQQGGDVR